MSTSQCRESGRSRVLAAADRVTSNREASLEWFGRPLAAFGGKTPEELVALGRADDLVGYLDSVSSGFVG